MNINDIAKEFQGAVTKLVSSNNGSQAKALQIYMTEIGQKNNVKTMPEVMEIIWNKFQAQKAKEIKKDYYTFSTYLNVEMVK